MAENVLARVNMSGLMRQSPLYATMGVGETDPIVLIGHANGLTINNPYQVANIQEAVNVMQADGNSPLLRALLEVYNVGCRDIWLIAAADMTEYEDDLSARFTLQYDGNTKNFYQKYFARLADTYNIIRDYEQINIVVPVEAPFYYTGGVDFLTQLATHCDDAFTNTGIVRLGILGTRIVNRSATDINAMASDPRPNALGDKGKFVAVIMGEGLVNLPQMPLSYSASVSTQAAGMLAVQDLHKGLTYARLANTISISGQDLTPAQQDALTTNRINPAIRSPRSKRGQSFQCYLASDNTCAERTGPLGTTISSYWSLYTMRLIYTCVTNIYWIGRAYIGNANNFLPAFKKDVNNYLQHLVSIQAIDQYAADVFRAVGSDSVQVSVTLYPKMGIRTVFFQVEVGPGV